MRISHDRGATRTAIHVHLSKKEQEQAMNEISILIPFYKTDSVLLLWKEETSRICCQQEIKMPICVKVKLSSGWQMELY